MMRNFLSGQADFVAFLYGLTLVLLAVVATVLVLARARSSRIAWVWLALYGLAGGSAEWLKLIAADLGDAAVTADAGLVLSAVSFLFLLEFARSTAAAIGNGRPGRWILLTFGLAAGIGGLVGPPWTEPIVRVALGLPAGLWSAWVLRRRSVPREVERPLSVAAWGLALHAVGVGAASPLSSVLLRNADAVLRSAVASGVDAVLAAIVLAAALALWQYAVRSDREDVVGLTLPHRPRYAPWLAAVLVAVLAVGWVATSNLGSQSEREHRDQLRILARACAGALDERAVSTLTGSDGDLGRPAYRFLKRELQQVREAYPLVRFVYLMGRRDDRVIFLVDAERESSPDYSPPGQTYFEASAALKRIFDDGQPFVEGPLVDRWGVWTSGLAPVRAERSSSIPAVLGIDIDASHMARAIAQARLMGILVTLFVCLLILIILLATRRDARARDALQAGEQRYRVISEQTGQIVYDWDIRTGAIEWAGAARQVTGYELREYQKVDIAAWERMIHPDDRARAMDLLDAAEHGSGRYRAEYRLRRKDGSYVHVEDAGAFLKDGEGRPVRMLGKISDLTEIRRAGEALRESLSRYEDVVSFIPSIVWRLDFDENGVPTTAVITESADRLLGLPAGTIGREPATYFSHVHPDDLPSILRTLDDALRRPGTTAAVEYRMTRADGGLRWFRTTGTARVSENGLAQAFGTTEDVTDRKRADEEKARLEAKLVQAQKMEAIGTLAGGIAHDFNNILVSILGFAELALAEAPEHGEIRNDLRQILDSGRRAKELVDQILAFSRQTEGARRPIRLENVVQDALHLLRATLPATIAIHADLPRDLHAVRANPTQMHQVLLNLGVNAGHAMPGGGELHVSLTNVILDDFRIPGRDETASGPFVRLAVTDTGVGMTPEIVARVFEPFFTTKEVGKGTGLGLAVVHGIVHHHGGYVTVYSEPGKGTTFHVYLPGDEGAAEAMDVQRNAAGEGDGERILVVDDEPVVALLIAKTLARAGFEATTRTSPFEALDLIRQDPGAFDLVLTDQTMPGLTGDRLAEEIHALRADLPIVLCSGFAYALTPEQLGLRGVQRLINKPVVGAELARAVREILDEAQSPGVPAVELDALRRIRAIVEESATA